MNAEDPKVRELLYDGNLFCGKGSCCPRITREGDLVTIDDPTDASRGKITMTVANYNHLLRQARPAKVG